MYLRTDYCDSVHISRAGHNTAQASGCYKLSGHPELSENKCLFLFCDRSCGNALKTSKALVRSEVLTAALLNLKSFGVWCCVVRWAIPDVWQDCSAITIMIKQSRNTASQDLLAQWHRVTFQNTWIFSNTWYEIEKNLQRVRLEPILWYPNSILTLILRRSRTGTVWFYTSTSNKTAAQPKLYTKSLTRDLKRMYSRLTLVRISINL